MVIAVTEHARYRAVEPADEPPCGHENLAGQVTGQVTCQMGVERGHERG